MKKFYQSLIVILVATTLSGCGFFEKKEIKADENWSVERIYSEAKAALDMGNYSTAITYYEQLEARFPFGEYAQQALLESAYAHYKNDDPETAIANIDRFIRIYPLNPNLDYAIYLRGLVNFHRDVGLVEKYVPRDESQRDPGSAEDAMRDFTNLIERYPNSRYADDAAQRIVHLRNRLAQHELNVANYYMRRSSYVAAANRAKYVIENYSRTPAMADALVIMAKAYKVLGLNDLSSDAMRVLQMNYPGHPGIADVKKTQVQ